MLNPPRMGIGDVVVDIAHSAGAHRAPAGKAVTGRSPTEAMPSGDAPAQLAAIAAEPRRDLSGRTIEPNGYYLADWQLAVNATARGRTGAAALYAWNDTEPAARRLIGLLPVIALRRATRIPLPALVSADPYGTLGTPLLDQDQARN